MKKKIASLPRRAIRTAGLSKPAKLPDIYTVLDEAFRDSNCRHELLEIYMDRLKGLLDDREEMQDQIRKTLSSRSLDMRSAAIVAAILSGAHTIIMSLALGWMSRLSMPAGDPRSRLNMVNAYMGTLKRVADPTGLYVHEQYQSVYAIEGVIRAATWKYAESGPILPEAIVRTNRLVMQAAAATFLIYYERVKKRALQN
jgi:hypothetical protein